MLDNCIASSYEIGSSNCEELTLLLLILATFTPLRSVSFPVFVSRLGRKE